MLILHAAAFALMVVVFWRLDDIEHFEPLRVGAHFDGVVLVILAAIVMELTALIIAIRRRKSVRISIVLCVVLFLVLLIGPVFIPATGMR